MFHTGTISFGRVFPPTTNCVAHYDASQPLTVHTSATKVSQWDDLTGLGHHLLQATGAKQPTYSGSGTSSLVTFDGSATWMQASFTLAQPVTIYSVCKQITWSSNAKLWDGVSANFDMSLIQISSSPNLEIYSTTGQVGAGTDPVLNTIMVVTTVYNGASSSILINNLTMHTGTVGSNNPGGITLGAVADGSQPGNVAFQEMFIYKVAHTAVQQAEVIAFLRSKWGI